MPELIIYVNDGYLIYSYLNDTLQLLKSASRPDFPRSYNYPAGFYKKTGHFQVTSRIQGLVNIEIKQLNEPEIYIVSATSPYNDIEEIESGDSSVDYSGQFGDDGKVYYTKGEFHDRLHSVVEGKTLTPFNFIYNDEENREAIFG